MAMMKEKEFSVLFRERTGKNLEDYIDEDGLDVIKLDTDINPSGRMALSRYCATMFGQEFADKLRELL